MKNERIERENKLNKIELAKHKESRGERGAPKFKADSPEKYEAYVEKRIKEKNITDPGDRLVERSQIASEYRKKHAGKLPGGWLKSDE